MSQPKYQKRHYEEAAKKVQPSPAEPEECVECGATDPMGLFQVAEVSNDPDTDYRWAWICDECGHAHLCAEVAPSLFVEEPMVDRSEVVQGALKSAIFAVIREQSAESDSDYPEPSWNQEDAFDYQDAFLEDAEDDPDPEDLP